MHRRAVSCFVAAALLAGGCGRRATQLAGLKNSVLPSYVSVDLGKHTRFRALLADMGVVWSVPGSGDGGFVSGSGMYYAPLRAPAVPTIRILATQGSSNAEATVRLTSRPADSGDCLADGQPKSQADPGEYVYVEELPEAFLRVAPSYPDPAREAGVQGTVVVLAHVCACGEVGETRIASSIPMLDLAAAGAIQQWIFRPARTAGEPVAVWVNVPVRFSLH
jgi:protein TonB